MAGSRAGRGWWRDGGSLVPSGVRVTLGRPPAVAVVGLRRSGRTGNGESPCGHDALACQDGQLRSLDSHHSGAPGRAASTSVRRASRALD
jgi:hypothetical protein